MIEILLIVLFVSLAFILLGLFVPDYRGWLLSIGIGVIVYIPALFGWIFLLYFRYASIDRLAHMFSIDDSDGIWGTLLFLLPPLIPVIIILVALNFRRNRKDGAS